MIEKQFDLTLLTDEELNNFYTAWINEAKRREKQRRRNAALLLYEAIGQFIDTMAYYDFEKQVPMEYVSEEGEDCEFYVDVFSEEVLDNIRNTLRLKVGQYSGEDE